MFVCAPARQPAWNRLIYQNIRTNAPRSHADVRRGFAKPQTMTRRRGTAVLAQALLAVGLLSGAAAVTDKVGSTPFCSGVLLSL